MEDRNVQVAVSIYPVDGRMVETRMGIDPELLEKSLRPLPRHPYDMGLRTTYTIAMAVEYDDQLARREAAIRDREDVARHVSRHLESSLLQWFSRNDTKETT